MASTRNFMHLVLLTLVLLLASLNQAAENQTSGDQPPILPDRRQWIAYYITRMPPQIFGSIKRVEAPFKQIKSKADLSLWRHAYHSKFKAYEHSTSPYIFLVSSVQQALEFARSISEVSYIYSVHLDERSIDVRATFGHYFEPFEDRWAIFGDLLFAQIESWRSVKKGHYSEITFNPAFEWATYLGNVAYGAAPQLAGFPKNHPALSEAPWNETICNFNSSSTDPPEQQTCQPDSSYAVEFEGLAPGILMRLRDGQMQPKDCPFLLPLLNLFLPGLKKRTKKFTDENACQRIRTMIKILACPTISHLEAKLVIGDLTNAGTYDIIKFIIGGESGKATLAMGEYFSAGYQRTVSVNISPAFKSSKVAIDHLEYLDVTDAQQQSGPGGDWWYCKAIQLRATCTDSGSRLEMKKLDPLDKWYYRPGDDYSSDLLLDKVLERFLLYPRDWETVWMPVQPGIKAPVGPIPRFEEECWDHVINWRDCLRRIYEQIEW